MDRRSKYVFFWGCMIPARLPFMEKSIRLILEKLDVKYIDLDGFTCCPEKSLVKNFREKYWFLTALRNIALAEREGLDILVACNGCYSTLKSAAAYLENNPILKEEVNQELAGVGLRYKGFARIKHLVELFHDEVGTGKIRSLVEKPLAGMHIAVHPGCHMLRPSTAIRFDDPLHPTKYDALVKALGAGSVDYDTKMMCCGGGLGHAGEEEGSMALARKKLLELRRLEVDAMTLNCPACFIQFDQKQYMAQRQGEHLHIPVVTMPELIGLSFGLEPAELGLGEHRVDLSPFLEKWQKKLSQFAEVKRHLDLSLVRRCYECRACLADCPVAEIVDRFKPQELIGKVLDGKIEQLLSSKDIWYCVECHTCSELCPQKFGMEKVFSTLKHLAIDYQTMPASIKGGVDVFLKSGRLAQPDEKKRKKLGLPGGVATGVEDLQKLLGLIKES